MSDNVKRLLGKLKTAQRELILVAAQTDALPPDSLIRKVSELEVMIGAIEHMLEEDDI